MMTGHGDVGVAIAALTHGAIALVEKPFSKEIIERALQLGFLKLEDAPAYRRHMGAAAASVGALEPGERAVLACLAAGRSNEATAEELGIPVASVEVRRARLLPQLGAESVNEALTIAFAAGFAPAGGGLRDIT
jgi:two-component system response regulator FixJ